MCVEQVANLDEFKQLATAAVKTVTPEMLRFVLAEISYHLDMSCHRTRVNEIYCQHFCINLYFIVWPFNMYNG